MESVRTYLERAVAEKASDLFIIAGKAASMKCEGEITPMGEDRLMPEDSAKLVRELYGLAHRPIERFLSVGDDDFSLTLAGLARFRVNAYRQRSSMAAVIRVVSFGIPDWKENEIPEEVMRIASLQRGLVLVTGPAGSGKSTTLACIVDRMNQTRNAHIITIEDPIEFLHRNQQCIISQRELDMDTSSYGTALRASLRQAPDVILLGEMRDLDTIQTAITAAETGHLVISTLHTLGAANSVDRIIDIFPHNQQQQIRVQLGQVLRTVVSQQLLPTVDGSRQTPAFEIMHMNNAIRSHILKSDSKAIAQEIFNRSAENMINMDRSIQNLYSAGRISMEIAINKAMDPEEMRSKLNRASRAAAEPSKPAPEPAKPKLFGRR